MAQQPTSSRPASAAAPRLSFGQAFRRYFVTGLATLFPVAVTVIVVWQIFKVADGFFGDFLGVTIPGLGLLVTVLVILLVGVLAVHFFGRVLFRTIEMGVSRLPIFRKIYPSVKQLGQFLFDEEAREKAFRGVVLVQYPRLGTYCIAFVTNEHQTTANGMPQTLLTILLPNPPSPFTGPVIFVPKEDAIPLTLTVEDAVKFIVSGGVVTPPLVASKPTTDHP